MSDVTSRGADGVGRSQDRRWRTRDIVVVAVIAAAFGVFFAALDAAFAAVNAGAGSPMNLLYGGWLLPAVVAPVIVRKPGAALFAELVAAAVSMLVLSQYGADTLLSGFLQGIGAEIVFAVFRYRDYRWAVVALASVVSATLAFAHDWIIYYQGTAVGVMGLTYVFMLISAAVLMPIVTFAVVRALRQAGALRGFPA